jgi:hypothetical protein
MIDFKQCLLSENHSGNLLVKISQFRLPVLALFQNHHLAVTMDTLGIEIS